MLTEEQKSLDLALMQEVMLEAGKCEASNDVPVGAIIVQSGRIIARAHNCKEARQDATAHAEIEVIRQACQALGTWHLEDCTIYVSLEPCLMCAGAIINARCQRLVYATSDSKTGACGSLVNVFALRLNHQVELRAGVLQAEGKEVLQRFFRQKRWANKQLGTRAYRKKLALAKQNSITAPQEETSDE